MLHIDDAQVDSDPMSGAGCDKQLRNMRLPILNLQSALDKNICSIECISEAKMQIRCLRDFHNEKALRVHCSKHGLRNVQYRFIPPVVYRDLIFEQS